MISNAILDKIDGARPLPEGGPFPEGGSGTEFRCGLMAFHKGVRTENRARHTLRHSDPMLLI